jgi:hypothetical protein
VRALERRWLAPAPARRLAASRVVIGAFSVHYLLRRRRMLAGIAAQDERLYAPVGAAHLAPRPLPERTARAITDATLASGVAFTAGAGHRVSGPAHAALLLWTLSYRNSWSMVFHNDNLMVLHVAVLGLSRSADAWSVDATLRPRTARSATTGWQYGWPLRLMRTVTASTYFLAGVAKVSGPLGWRWATGESLRRQVAADGVRKEVLGKPAAPAAYALYRHVALFRILAVGSLAVELAAPAMLLSSRLSRLWALNAFAMHWGILALMDIRFRYSLSGVAFAPFLDLERVVAGAGALLTRR